MTDKPIEVEVTQFDTAGTPLPTFQITTQPFQPFGAFDATAAKVGGSCRVSFKGGKDDVRAHICIFEPDKGCTVIVPAR